MLKNYSATNVAPLPQAFITVNKSRKRIQKENKVYLPKGINFEIELFNPLQVSVLAKISINNIEDSNGLILKPGQRYFLDRYISEAKKFLFETYEVNNSPEVLKAIELNGLVSIKFYEEQVIKYTTYTYSPPNYTYITNTNDFVVGGTYSDSNITYGVLNNNLNLRSLNTTTSIAASANLTLTNSIETGRIEKGEKSNQEFKDAYMDFSPYVKNEINYKLLPESQKHIETKELKKVKKFCPSCSSKIENKDWNFCPNCQFKL